MQETKAPWNRHLSRKTSFERHLALQRLRIMLQSLKTWPPALSLASGLAQAKTRTLQSKRGFLQRLIPLLIEGWVVH